MKKSLMFLLVVLLAQGVFAEWEAYDAEDLMAGVTKVFIVNTAVTSQGTLREPAILIRQGGEGYEVFIDWGGYNLDRKTRTMTARFGDNEPETIPASLSTSAEAVFITDSLNKLLEVDSFIALVYSATNRQMVAKWDVTGLKEALKLIK